MIWNLYQEYERLLQLAEPIDPEELLTRENKEEHTIDNIPIAIIETIPKVDVFELNAIFQRK